MKITFGNSTVFFFMIAMLLFLIAIGIAKVGVIGALLVSGGAVAGAIMILSVVNAFLEE